MKVRSPTGCQPDGCSYRSEVCFKFTVYYVNHGLFWARPFTGNYESYSGIPVGPTLAPSRDVLDELNQLRRDEESYWSLRSMHVRKERRRKVVRKRLSSTQKILSGYFLYFMKN